MKKIVIASIALAASLATSPAFAQKYWITIGCWPDYKMHRIACNVGESQQHCARMACYNMDVGLKKPGTLVNVYDENAPRAPKLFSTPGNPK